MGRQRHSKGKKQKAVPAKRAVPAATAQDKRERKHPLWAWLAGVLALVIGTSSPVWVPPLGEFIKGAFTSDPSAPPLTVTTEPTFLDDQGRTMATPDGALPSPSLRRLMTEEGAASSSAFLSAVQAIGGVDVENLSIQLVVTGNSTQGVRILDIRPVDLQRTKPLGGTLFSVPSQAGSATLRMMFDLDEPVPIARTIGQPPPCHMETKGDVVECVPTADPYPQWFDDADHGLTEYPGSSFFDNETITLADHEQQVLNIRAEVEKTSVAFDLEIDYIVGGASGDVRKITVSNHGKPFRVTGMSLGAKPGTWSYLAAFNLNGDFSLCPVPDSQHISIANFETGPPCS